MTDVDKLVTASATKYMIPAELVRAIMIVESAGDPWAYRNEPGYRWLWDVRIGLPYEGDPQSLPAPRGVSQATELMGQQTSWGLMQVMGATARELGFRGRYLTALLDPEMSLEYGCRYLQVLFQRHRSWEPVAAAYNAGSPRRASDGRWQNQRYVDAVREAGGFG